MYIERNQPHITKMDRGYALCQLITLYRLETRKYIERNQPHITKERIRILPVFNRREEEYRLRRKANETRAGI
jgi:hypothetical protein